MFSRLDNIQKAGYLLVLSKVPADCPKKLILCGGKQFLKAVDSTYWKALPLLLHKVNSADSFKPDNISQKKKSSGKELCTRT